VEAYSGRAILIILTLVYVYSLDIATDLSLDRWVDNIILGWGDVDWIGMARDRDRWRAPANSVLNGSIKCWETIECPGE
jgi:hypothetical protein